jgi:hypothetical protein
MLEKMTLLVTQLSSFLFSISLYLQTVTTLSNEWGSIQEKRLLVGKRKTESRAAFALVMFLKPNQNS